MKIVFGVRIRNRKAPGQRSCIIKIAVLNVGPVKLSAVNMHTALRMGFTSMIGRNAEHVGSVYRAVAQRHCNNLAG